MPVAAEECGDVHVGGAADPGVQRRNNVIALCYRQRAAGTEVVLDIHDDKGIAGLKVIAHSSVSHSQGIFAKIREVKNPRRGFRRLRGFKIRGGFPTLRLGPLRHYYAA
jgi:hypothetical protein